MYTWATEDNFPCVLALQLPLPLENAFGKYRITVLKRDQEIYGLVLAASY